MTYLELLKLLLPFGTYTDAPASLTEKDLTAAARALENCEANAHDIVEDEIFPDKADELLPDWERVYGIIPDTDISWAARVDNLLASIRSTGGLSRAHFIALAARLGYTITIDEFEPAMAGWAECGDTLYIEDIVYVWQVNVQNSSTVSYFAEAGIAHCGDSLNYFSDAFLEALFNRLKPAHTSVVFAYL